MESPIEWDSDSTTRADVDGPLLMVGCGGFEGDAQVGGRWGAGDDGKWAPPIRAVAHASGERSEGLFRKDISRWDLEPLALLRVGPLAA